MPGAPVFPHYSRSEDDHQKGKRWISIHRKKGLFVAGLLLLFGVGFFIFDLQKPAKIVHLRQCHPNFLKRKEYSKLIESNLKKAKDRLPIVALYGEGGIGKSELAIAYGNKHLKDYSLIHWVDAATPESYRNSYELLAGDLQIQFTKQDPTELLIQKIHHHLESHPFRKPWLLIYDNADQSIPMPQRGKGAILITSRNFEPWNLFTCIKILPLSEEESEQLFANIIGTSSSPARLQVIKKLDYLPLALNLAAHYIAETPNLSEAEYLELLDKDPLLFNCSENEWHSNSLISSWKMTLERLHEKNSDAWACLHFFAYLSPDLIPRDWIEKWLIHLHPDADPNDLKIKANNVFRLLFNNGLIQYNKKSKIISIHRLKQHCMKFDRHYDPLVSADVLSFLIQKFQKLRYYDLMECSFEEWPELSVWVASAVHFLQNSKDSGEGIAKLQTLIGNWKCLKGDYLAAVAFHEAAIQNLPNRQALGIFLNNLAWANWKSGSYEAALNRYREAISAYQTSYAEDHPEMTFITNNLSLMLVETGRFEEAKEINLKNLEIRKKNFGIEHVTVANSMHNLAWTLLNQGELKAAISYYTQACQIYQKLFGNDHPYVAIGFHHLGRALCLDNHFSEAENLCKTAMNFYMKFYGKEHPYVAKAQYNLGQIYEKMELDDQAFKAYLGALEIALAAFPVHHPEQAKYFSSLLNLIETSALQKKKEKLKRNIYLLCIKSLNNDHEFIQKLK